MTYMYKTSSIYMYIFLKKCSDNATNTCLKIDIYFGCTCFLFVFVAGSMNDLGSLLKSKRLQMCFTHYLFFSIFFHKDKTVISRYNLDKTYPLHVPGILFSKINRFLHISLIFKRCRSPKQWRDTIGAVVEQSARSKE